MPPDPAEPAYRLTVAPRFAVAPVWRERLTHSAGIAIAPDSGAAHPRGAWTPLDEAALAALVDPAVTRAESLPPTHLGLILLPERLRRAWWACAERGGEGTLPPPAEFEAVFAEIAAFLRFKRLPMPERLALEVAVSAPGARSTRAAGAGSSGGLGFGEHTSDDSAVHFPLGILNLGDEATFAVVLVRPPETLVARLGAGAAGLPPQALASRYLSTFPDEQVLRVRLAPGEGLWLSPFGVVHDGSTEGKTDVDVVLTIGCA